MKKFAACLGVALALLMTSDRIVLSHCEIPCGIYGDTLRIALFYEDIATIEKSMTSIEDLSKDAGLNANQLARWVANKEEHANKVQHVVTQYFMTQRVKPKAEDDEGRGKYIKQLTALHGMLVHAMKAKQTTDTAHTAQLRKLVDQFSEAYFSAEDLKHIRSHRG